VASTKNAFLKLGSHRCVNQGTRETDLQLGIDSRELSKVASALRFSLFLVIWFLLFELLV